MATKRLQEELELSEAQKKRMAQVQEAAQFYTEEDWDTIRAKLEANADLVKEIAGEDVSEADYAQRMVGLISQRRKLIAEQKAKAQRDKPMTQAQQRQYMATYLKNQGGWKLAQIKKLTDEELKEKFEYLMRSMERFVPMDTEKESRKRTGVELQTESSKKLKSDTREDVSVPKEKDKESVKREEEFEIKKPVLRYTKRKSLARKGLQKKPESAKSGTEEDVEAYMEERVDEPSSEEFPMSSIPQGPAPAKIVKWQIIKTGKRGAYQIIREDNTDVVYVNFPGLLNDLIRDDLKELYRLMMLKYGNKRPEEEYEGCGVHCLTVEAAHIDILTEVKYPLPPRVCKSMLEKKLLRDRKDEICLLNDLIRDDLKEMYRLMMLKYGNKRPEEEYEGCGVHCLTVEAAHIDMLTEVKYPLPPRVCKSMLEKKLLGDRKDEIYKELFMSLELRRDNTWWRCYALTQQIFTKNYMVINAPWYCTEALASPRANGYLVKPTSNPLIADDLLKIIITSITKEQQQALDDTLVPPFLISADVPAIYMHEFWATVSYHKHTIKFKINKKSYSFDMETFREMLHICPNRPGQKFEDPPFKEEILAFMRQLGYSGNIKSLSDVKVETLPQPWRTFRTIINKCLSGKVTGLDLLRLSRAQIL
ncbi:hypothetical protein Tco_1134335 [Tanacetum coccineum]